MFEVTISRPTEFKIAIAWDSKNGDFLLSMPLVIFGSHRSTKFAVSPSSNS